LLLDIAKNKMTLFAKFIERVLPRNIPTPVGRWRVEHCEAVLGKRVDMSNEDHCGPCGQYAIDKLLDKKKNTKK
jgi:hypothetical protein